MIYITTTFTVNMLKESCNVRFEKLNEVEFIRQFKEFFGNTIVPAISHENTARMLGRKLGIAVNLYNRVNITLEPGDIAFVAVPKLRFSESREFTDEEIQQAEFAYWKVTIKFD